MVPQAVHVRPAGVEPKRAQPWSHGSSYGPPFTLIPAPECPDPGCPKSDCPDPGWPDPDYPDPGWPDPDCPDPAGPTPAGRPATARMARQRVPMPLSCPEHYWVDVSAAEALRLGLREHTFLSNPRTPATLASRRTDVFICAGSASAGGVSAGSVRAGRTGGAARGASSSGELAVEESLSKLAPSSEMVGQPRRRARTSPLAAALPGRTDAESVLRALDPFRGSKILTVHGIEHLQLGGIPPRGLSLLTKPGSDWCSSCSVPGRAAQLADLRADGRRELEQFCKVQARATRMHIPYAPPVRTTRMPHSHASRTTTLSAPSRPWTWCGRACLKPRKGRAVCTRPISQDSPPYSSLRHAITGQYVPSWASMPSRVSMCHHGLACHHGSVCAIMG